MISDFIALQGDSILFGIRTVLLLAAYIEGCSTDFRPSASMGFYSIYSSLVFERTSNTKARGSVGGWGLERSLRGVKIVTMWFEFLVDI